MNETSIIEVAAGVTLVVFGGSAVSAALGAVLMADEPDTQKTLRVMLALAAAALTVALLAAATSRSACWRPSCGQATQPETAQEALT